MRQFFYSVIAVLLLGMLVPQAALAAQLFFETETEGSQTGVFEVRLYVDAEEEPLNAFEGTVLFSDDIVALRDIRDGNSIVNFWVERPRNSDGAIKFSGITPGGFEGERGLLFSVVLEGEETGTALFDVKEGQILWHDGVGTAATLSTTPLAVDVVFGQETASATLLAGDTKAPEPFVPEIGQDTALFDGQWFVVFATTDKGSGVDRYEMQERRQSIFSLFSSRRVVESPALLSDQNLNSRISITAIDKNGNEYVAELPPRNPRPWYDYYENWIILIGVGLVLIYTVKRIVWGENER